MTRGNKKALIVYVDDATIQALDDMTKVQNFVNLFNGEGDTSRSSVARTIIEEHVKGFDRERVVQEITDVSHAISSIGKLGL